MRIFVDTAQEMEKQRNKATPPTPPSLRPGGRDRNQPVSAEPQITPEMPPPGVEGGPAPSPGPTPPTPPSLRPGGAPRQPAPSAPTPPSLRPGGAPRPAPPPPTPPTPPSLRPGGAPRPGPQIGPQVGPQAPTPPSLRPGGQPRPGPQVGPQPPSLRPGGSPRPGPPSIGQPTPPSLRPGGRDRNEPPSGRPAPPTPPSLRPGGRDRNEPPSGMPAPPTPPSLRPGARQMSGPPEPPSGRPIAPSRLGVSEPPSGSPTPPTPPSLRPGGIGSVHRQGPPRPTPPGAVVVYRGSGRPGDLTIYADRQGEFVFVNGERMPVDRGYQPRSPVQEPPAREQGDRIHVPVQDSYSIPFSPEQSTPPPGHPAARGGWPQFGVYGHFVGPTVEMPGGGFQETTEYDAIPMPGRLPDDQSYYDYRTNIPPVQARTRTGEDARFGRNVTREMPPSLRPGAQGPTGELPPSLRPGGRPPSTDYWQDLQDLADEPIHPRSWPTQDAPPSLRPGVPPLGMRRDVGRTPDRETGEGMDAILRALDAPREYVGAPPVGNLLGAFTNEQGELDWREFLDPPNYGEAGRSLWGTTRPSGYQEGRESYEDIREGLPRGGQVALDVLSDPLMYIAPGVGGAISRSARTPGALRAGLSGTRNPAAAAIEGVGPARVPLTALGSAAGIEAADRFDIPYVPEQVEQIGAQLIGGGLGASIVRPRGAIAGAVRGSGDQSPRQRVQMDIGEGNVPIIRGSETPSPELRTATDKILEGSRRERNLRRTGTAQREVREGRRRQAQGVREGIEQARAEGLSGEEAVRRGRSGAQTGQMRQNVARIELSPDERSAVFDELGEMATRGDISTFDYLRGTKAVQKLVDGEGLQPNEIKLIRRTFGDEVADSVKDRPKTQRQLEQQEARERQQVEQRTERAVAKQQTKTEREIQKANRQAFDEQFKADKQYFREKWKAIARQQELNQQEVDDLWNDLRTSPEEREIALGELQGRAQRLQREAGEAFEGAQDREAKRLRQMRDEFDKADRSEARQAERAFTREQRELQRQRQKAERAETTEAVTRQEAKDREFFENKWRSLYTPDEDGRLQDIPERLTRQLDSPVGMSDVERRIARKALDRRINKVQSAAADAAEWASRRELPRERVLYRRQLYETLFNKNDKRLALEARDAIEREVNKLDISDDLKQQIPETLDAWRKSGEVRLDAADMETRALMRLIAKPMNLAAGRHADSYLATVTAEKGTLRTALEMNGLDPKAAKSISDTLGLMRVRKKFKNGISQQMAQDMVDAEIFPVKMVRKIAPDPEAITVPVRRTGDVGESLGNISQRIKNLQFGIGDLAVFGQQLPKAFASAGPAALTGLINRTLMMLHLPHLTPYDQSLGITKQVAYNLDGTHQGIMTGMHDVELGESILSSIGLGKIDRPLMKMADNLTQLQFGVILGSVRNMIHEGNLVMAHLAGEDVADPLVRSRAAAFANAATSAAARAQRRGQAGAERGLLLSPSMRRAQASQLTQMARLLSPKARKVDRVLAATTIASQGIYIIAAGKLVHDYFGVGDFEYDPSKPGFGRITVNIMGRNQTIDFFPQDQLQSALTKSIRLLSEEEPMDAAEAWARVANNSASPPMQTILKSFGVGYDPQRGYMWGNYGANMDTMERFITGLPIPPIGQSLYREGPDRVETPLEGFGLTSFEENPSVQIARRYKETTGRDYWEDIRSEPGMVDQWLDDHPDMEAMHQRNVEERAEVGEAWAENMLESQSYEQEFKERQRALDEQLRNNEIEPEQWRQQRSENLNTLFAKRDTIYENADTQEEKDLLDRYYEKLEEAEDETGRFDYGPVEAWLQGLSRQDRLKIERNTGLRDETPVEQEYSEDVEYIANSGYWDLYDQVAERFAQETPGIPNDIKTRGELERHVREEVTRRAEQDGYDPSTTRGKAFIDQWVGNALSDYYEWSRNARELLRERDPQLLEKLLKWGYKPASEDDLEALGAGN